MPVERGSFFRTGDGIVDSDGDGVAPISFDCRTGKLAVDEEYIFLVAVWCYSTSCDCEFVGPRLSCTNL